MVTAKRNSIDGLKGIVAPDFEYQNQFGAKVKRSAFKGKYMYIDIWATWCAPCKTEIPHLQRAIQKYNNKAIEFISISVDELKDLPKWEAYVIDQKLSGTQVIADRDWKSAWIQAFAIDAIPRFIIIDRDGIVLDADAPRPSSPLFHKKLDVLLK